eukprot:1140417-Pelagomonas_calceolata.AAC.3
MARLASACLSACFTAWIHPPEETIPLGQSAWRPSPCLPHLPGSPCHIPMRVWYGWYGLARAPACLKAGMVHSNFKRHSGTRLGWQDG